MQTGMTHIWAFAASRFVGFWWFGCSSFHSCIFISSSGSGSRDLTMETVWNLHKCHSYQIIQSGKPRDKLLASKTGAQNQLTALTLARLLPDVEPRPSLDDPTLTPSLSIASWSLSGDESQTSCKRGKSKISQGNVKKQTFLQKRLSYHASIICHQKYCLYSATKSNEKILVILCV